MSQAKQIALDLTRRRTLKVGLYGSLAAGIAPGLLLSACSGKSRPDIILITLDTTRADHLGCYGYSRPTTPNLDHLAAESVLYTKAIAPSSWTLPSHAALFTGKFTTSHGARYDPEGPLRLDRAIRKSKYSHFRARGLAEDETTVAQTLKETGYATGAVLAGPWLKKVFGLHRGFDTYDDDCIDSVSGRLARQVTASALNWVEEHKTEELFLFLNYYDPHSPYIPPEKFAWVFTPPGTGTPNRKVTLEERVALYDGEILYMDRYVGRLLDQLRSDGLYDNALIIVTADHGELLGEHGKFGHGNYLHQEEIHVPLFIKYPRGEVAPERIDTSIQLVDLMAIILDRLGLALPPNAQSGMPPNTGHPVIAEAYPLPVLSSDGHWRAIIVGSHKLIWNSDGNHQLFDLKNDPGELDNLLTAETQRADSMLSGLNGYLASLPAPGQAGPPQAVDEETTRALEALGYF